MTVTRLDTTRLEARSSPEDQHQLPVASDGIVTNTRVQRVSIPGGLAYLILVASGAGMATFGLSLALVRRKAPGGVVMPVGQESPSRLGLRALLWGTVWAVAGTGAVAVSVTWVAKLCGVKLVCAPVIRYVASVCIDTVTSNES